MMQGTTQALLALVATALAVASGVGCKRQSLHEISTTAYIVGPTNDIKPLEGEAARELGPEVVNAAVLVATRLADKRVKFCSGTLLPAEAGSTALRILSNHHCFAEADAEGKATRTLLGEACTYTKIYFGYTVGHTAETFASTCQSGTLRTNFEGDLAVLTLSQNPPERYRPIALWSGEDAPTGRTAAIVHFPDVDSKMETPPEGGAKLPTAAITIDDCTVLGGFPIGEWDLDRTLPFSLRHTCDLIHGSSGSGLIDVKTGTLLGVNWGGIKITFEDGVRTDNVATRASYVAAFLERRVEEAVKSAEGQRRRHEAAAQPRQDDDGIKKKSQNFSDGVKKSACGSVMGGLPEGTGSGSALALLLLVLVWPLALWIRPGQRS